MSSSLPSGRIRSFYLNNKDVQQIMKKWVEEPGYPILNVTSNRTHFFISQPQPRWIVSVTYVLQGQSIDKPSRIWLNETNNAIIPAGNAKWILLNLNQTGYYRVNYGEDVLDGLIKDFDTLPEISRSQLIDDMFSLALSNDHTVPQLLQLLLVLQKETDYYTWNSALRNFQNLIDRFFGHVSYEQLKSFMLNQMKAVIDNVGMVRRDWDSHTDILKRVMVLEKACAFGHFSCLKQAVNNFENWKAKSYFDADLTLGLMCSAVANSSDNTWLQLLTDQKKALVPSVRSEMLKALTCTNNETLLHNYLTNISTSTQSILNPKDKNIFLQTLASTPFGANVLLNWLLEKLDSQFGFETTTLSPLTSTTAGLAANSTETANNFTERDYTSVPTAQNLTDEDIQLILTLIEPKLTNNKQVEKLERLAAAMKYPGLQNATLELIEKTRVQVNKQYKWAENNNENILKWLQTPPSTPGVITNVPTTQTTMISPTGKPTGKPNSATSHYSSLALIILVFTSHYFIPH